MALLLDSAKALQTNAASGILRSLLTADVDLVGTSDDRGASKPDLASFEKAAGAVPYATPRSRTQ